MNIIVTEADLEEAKAKLLELYKKVSEDRKNRKLEGYSSDYIFLDESYAPFPNVSGTFGKGVTGTFLRGHPTILWETYEE